MRMQNDQWKFNNKVYKKSHILMIGSFLIFVGFISLNWNYFLKMKDAIYSDMRILMMDDNAIRPTTVSGDIIATDPAVETGEDATKQNYVVDYSKYLGVLEIPKIGLKRGFYNVGSKYNNIKYNVTMASGSTLPDVANGNLILMAHSGDAYISYFAYLWKLELGDYAYVTYNGVKYQYQITDIYNVEKIGIVQIRRNYDATSLTLITCTKNSDHEQTVYVAELVG